jgi:16S rRNA (guanine(966)-N(2))-methyltransferase RsmD
MRIIAGEARGRTILMKDKLPIRPTADKIRGAIFSALQSHVTFSGISVLDLFSGTGAMGLEALSRGAKTAIFVDSNAGSLELSRRNWDAVNLKARVVEFIRADYQVALTRLAGTNSFDVVFADPPYRTDCLEKLLQDLNVVEALAPHGLLVCETYKEFVWPEDTPLMPVWTRDYGDTRVIFAVKKEAPHAGDLPG